VPNEGESGTDASSRGYLVVSVSWLLRLFRSGSVLLLAFFNVEPAAGNLLSSRAVLPGGADKLSSLIQKTCCEWTFTPAARVSWQQWKPAAP
jgi:hypothetical protein